MRILLDTHVLLWAVGQSDRLPGVARELLEDTDNALFCSAASLWEIAIKTVLRRENFRVDLRQLRDALAAMEIEELPILGRHAEALVTLPQLHADPFDRMLVAQSKSEPMVLLTSDAALGQYGESVRLV